MYAADFGYPAQPPFGEAKVLRSGEWEYKLYYKDKGKKSEGILGHLLFRGEPIPVSIVPEFINTPWGDMTFLPAPKTLNRKGIVMGWTYREYDKIPWTITPRPSDSWGKRNDWRLRK
jgi:hypothetical protein